MARKKKAAHCAPAADSRIPGTRPLIEWVPEIYESACKYADRMLKAYRGAEMPGDRSLVHQTVGRLLACGAQQCTSRDHALSLLVKKMHWVLIDHIRRQICVKRGGLGRRGVPPGEDAAADDPATGRHHQAAEAAAAFESEWGVLDFLALDEALDELRAMSQRQARVVELRFLLGLTVHEAAAEVGVSPATVKSDSASAQAWLRRRLAASSE